MENEMISIIVPIYKVEKYINECIESIINQSYKNIEIILVDDGSPDNCGKICDEYAKTDNRIIVVHKENGGLSDARNAGLDIAKGKYVAFVDSDDYIDNKYIELLYKTIVKNNVRISQCGVNKFRNNGKVIEKIGYKEKCIKTNKQMLKEMHEANWENVVVWNKMYLSELFKDIRFPKGKIHEDEYTTYKILYKTDKIAIVDEYLYNYRTNEESIMGKKFNIKRLDILGALEERIAFFDKHQEKELYDIALDFYLQKLRECYLNVKENINEAKEIEKELIEKHRNYSKYILKSKKIKEKSKLKVLIFLISPQLFYKIKKH